MNTFDRLAEASVRMLVVATIVAIGCNSTPAGPVEAADAGSPEDATSDVAIASGPEAGADACALAQPCTPPSGDSCQLGTIACDGTCGAFVNAADGDECSVGVCQNGACVPCVPGSACSPTGIPCDYGLLSCGATGPVCLDQHAQEPAGTACGAPGASTFCDRLGNCNCTANQACVFTANPCHQGVTSCTVSGSEGVATCTDSGNEVMDAGAACAVGDGGADGGDD